MHPLDNPIWYALNTFHAGLAQGNALAKRYPLDVAPFAAIAEPSEAAFEALKEALQPQGIAGFFAPQPWIPRPGWEVINAFILSQMVCMALRPVLELPCQTLSEADVPEMQALVELTRPGPFKPHTIRLGIYLGLREGGKLVAMAGERLHLSGYTEVSAVCTHPDYQGRGYAKALVHQVCRGIVARGETPFLHVAIDNAPAIRAYQGLGFLERSRVYGTVLRCATN
ncbi:MAG: GNAT family N-acetyltransferase [Thermaceae bacterium]|nr:GNAT family N-acetyltransferase [Thermaceae bacterium]